MKWLQAFQSLLGFGLSTPLKTQSWGGTQSVMILASTLFFVQLIHSSCQSIYWPPVAATMPSQEDKSLYLPMLLHGDGGAFQSSDSINVISMRSFLSSANVATSQLLLLAIPKACCNKSSNSEEDTMTALWNVLQWSFNAVWCGKWPEKDHLGEAWRPKSYRHSKAGSALNSNGYCGWLFGITCDGEYQQNEFGLQGHSYNQCLASKDTATTEKSCPVSPTMLQMRHWRQWCLGRGQGGKGGTEAKARISKTLKLVEKVKGEVGSKKAAYLKESEAALKVLLKKSQQ